MEHGIYSLTSFKSWPGHAVLFGKRTEAAVSASSAGGSVIGAEGTSKDLGLRLRQWHWQYWRGTRRQGGEWCFYGLDFASTVLGLWQSSWDADFVHEPDARSVCWRWGGHGSSRYELYACLARVTEKVRMVLCPRDAVMRRRGLYSRGWRGRMTSSATQPEVDIRARDPHGSSSVLNSHCRYDAGLTSWVPCVWNLVRDGRTRIGHSDRAQKPR